MKPNKYNKIMEISRSELEQAPAALASATLTAKLSHACSLSASQVSRYLGQLEREGFVQSSGRGKGKSYVWVAQTGARQLVHRRIAATEAGLRGEDFYYQTDLLPALYKLVPALQDNVTAILRHGFTEMLNNAIDHAQASFIEFTLSETRESLCVQICDDGKGVFATVRDAFDLPTMMEAVAEIAKGRRTSMPERHAGEGIFFTSRLVDQFKITANNLQYAYFSGANDWSFEEIAPVAKGSEVSFEIRKGSEKSPELVFSSYTDANFQFNIGGQFNVLPYTIHVPGDMISRSEAKRLLAGAEKFEHIIMDFNGVKRVGQGFADEVFRVFILRYPRLRIEPKNMSAAVAFMIQRAMPPAR